MARWVNNTIAEQKRSPKGFGQHIRSYVEGRGVKDERTGVEQDLQKTLDGDLDAFLKASLADKNPKADIAEGIAKVHDAH